jgi:large subunit ribosomal protein L3
MLNSVFATKLDMTQAWSKQGKRLAVTRCKVEDNLVLGSRQLDVINRTTKTQEPTTILEMGYGKKKLSNMSKPLQSKMQKGGFSVGAKQIRGVRVSETDLQVGSVVSLDSVLEVGDVVKVRGTTKGRGFAGVMKRHGFHGGPATHGQSDRSRAPGSIGAGTDPGRVWKGQRMAGHYGVETKTIPGLVVLHIDRQSGEVWLSGPIPGHFSSIVQITKTGEKKEVEIDKAASGIVEAPVVETPVVETAPEVTEEVQAEVVEEAQAEEATVEEAAPEVTE